MFREPSQKYGSFEHQKYVTTDGEAIYHHFMLDFPI